MTGGVIILTGPPGAGKTTLARRLAESSEQPAVHLVCDRFFDAIRSGFIGPWRPESNAQNRTINQAIAAAAVRYAQGDEGGAQKWGDAILAAASHWFA